MKFFCNYIKLINIQCFHFFQCRKPPQRSDKVGEFYMGQEWEGVFQCRRAERGTFSCWHCLPFVLC